VLPTLGHERMDAVTVVLCTELRLMAGGKMTGSRLRLTAPQVVARSLAIGAGEAEVMCDELAWFMRAVTSEGAALSPSRAIDRVWHALLSDSRAHTEFCRATCGVVIRHNAGSSSAEKYLRTLAALDRLRGEVPSVYWPRQATDEVIATCDGSTVDSPPPVRQAAVGS
jgi:hypothetical protein